ncbi:MAG: Azurin [Akkermansiaceae bacterium]|nr:Azurin [Akkermansiaceae bacterium]NNM30800.1 Azurin [Akkermansiaceae bacterium]
MKHPISLMTAAALALGTALSTAEEAQTATKTEAGAATKSEALKITITGNDLMQYDIKTFEAKAGQTIELTFKNIGVLPKEAMGHNVVVLKAGTDIPKFAMAGATQREGDFLPAEQEFKDQMIAHTKILGPGESETITFTAPGAGTYDYICTFPGHFGVMRGTMVVKDK